jgi:hypothetical protein
MKIKERENKESNKNQKQEFKTELILFIALNVLIVPFSVYQTYSGYYKSFDSPIMALVIAAISGLLFIAMNFGIRNSRLLGEKHILKVVMYLIPLTISFPGNFNAFYSNQMKNSLLSFEVTNYKRIMVETKDAAENAIATSENILGFKQDYNTHIGNLEDEFTKLPSGWGKNCNTYWRTLCTFLNENGGSINPQPTIELENEKIKFDRANTFAERQYNNILSSKRSKIGPTLNKISKTFSEIDFYIDSMLNLSTPIYSANMLNKIVESENLIRSKADGFLGENNIFNHPPLTISKENEIGTLKHSLNSGFVEWKDSSATIFSSFLSLIIDFSALLYILVFIPFNRTKKNKGGGRINHKGPIKI